MLISRAKADPSGNRRSVASVEVAPKVHAGRAPRDPAKLGDSGREVWREVWAVGAGAFNPPTDRFVIERCCEPHDRQAELLESCSAMA